MDHDNGFQGRQQPSLASTAAPTPQRPGTPTSDLLGRNPFNDGAESQASHRTAPNPFASPSASRPASSFGSSSAIGGGRYDAPGQRFFHSRRVKKDEVEKPWTKNVDPKEKWVTILPVIGILIGLAISGFLVWDGIHSVVKHNYCLVLADDFSGGLNEDVWTKEVQLGGFGNGEFEMTTGGDENVFIQDGKLMIKATLQDVSLMESNTKINLTADGTCTSNDPINCVALTNTTTGNATVIPPTKSGRLTTNSSPNKKGATIKYGRVEVTAKLPQGDWLWPAIWMMPVESFYGDWPKSGEIDIMESRGNNYTYGQGGNNIVSSTLHWGPNTANDGYWRANVKRKALHTTYSAGFNTFGLEWSQKYLFTYVNSRLLQVLYANFDVGPWARGGFPTVSSQGDFMTTQLWSNLSSNLNAPFDRSFYLILDVAVGGTNGWFQDDTSGKPWLDHSPKAPKDFWEARDAWFPTWVQPQMEVSKVMIWQQCDGNEDL
ncbi:concanavalin A-like lectin/glucanase [Thozetella sp. PMI_491]|nr:concanavalin A-like lectin/glucanase [Thozetella sp. PMI_491]